MEMFLTKDFKVEDLLCGAPSCSEACQFFSGIVSTRGFKSVQYDLQHDFACMADCSQVLALMQVAFLEKCDGQGLGPRGWPFSPPVGQILLQIVEKAMITASAPTWASSAGMLSTPGDFPVFGDRTEPNFFAKDRVYFQETKVRRLLTNERLPGLLDAFSG